MGIVEFQIYHGIEKISSNVFFYVQASRQYCPQIRYTCTSVEETKPLLFYYLKLESVDMRQTDRQIDKGRETDTDRQTETETDNSNSKTLFLQGLQLRLSQKMFC